jgi:hypothetical protein
MGYWGVVNNSLKNADIILQIVDARIPKDSINIEILRKAETMHKKIVFVYNKTDLINKENLDKLKLKNPESFFVSANKKQSFTKLMNFLNEEAIKNNKSLRIALIGYPNVGKSSILNILAPQARAKVSSVSGTTRETQWIRIGNLRFMDTPGVIPRTDNKIKVGLTASKDVHKLKNPDKVAYEVIKVLRKQNPDSLKKFYGIKFTQEESYYEIFLKIAQKRKYLLKGGEIDENRTVTKIIEDWQRGRIIS